MASRIKGITVEIGGDATGLSKALQGVNKEIRDTQAQLKDVDRLLKLDPTNTQLLEQRQRLLAHAVGDTKEKLDALKNAERQVQQQFQEGKASQEQYEALQREIVQTEQSLKDLEQQASKSNATMAKISATAESIGTSTTAAGRALAPVSAAAAGALAGIASMAVGAGKAADDINTMAKVTGLSVEQIQKFSYAADIIDVSLETMTGSMSKMIRNMSTARSGTGAAAEAFAALGVDITDSSGALRNSEMVFNDVISALGLIQNETERDAMAMQIFGRSAQELNPLILGGADALRQLGAEAEAAGLIMSQDALDAANAFNDELDILKATGKGTFNAIGAEVAEAFLPMLKDAAEALKNLLTVVRGMDQNTIKLIVTILALVAGLAPMLMLVGQIAFGVAGLSQAFLFLAANPIVLVIAAIVALVAALVAIEVKTKAFSTFFKEVWNGIVGIVKWAGNFIVSIFTEKIPAALDYLRGFFKSVFDAIAKMVKAPFNAIIKAVNWVIDGINGFFKWLNSFELPEFLGGGSLFNLKMIGKLPMLEKGGVLSRGSAIVGEKAPELLSLVNGRAVVTPLPGGARTAANASVGNAIQVTNYNRIDAGNLAQVEQLIHVLNGESRSYRMGYVRG